MAEAELRQSVTSTLQTYLDNEMPGAAMSQAVVTETNSVLDYALAEGLTLQAYVNKYPDKAQMQAQACVNEWLKIQSYAATSGVVMTTGGNINVSKNMTTLINERVNAAMKQMNAVDEMAYAAYTTGEKRREHLTRVLYNRAVMRGDTRALTYLIDRVDGRPAEARAVDVDMDNAVNVYKIIHGLFDKQLEVLNSGPGTKLICCSRQSGKSMLLCATALIKALTVPNTCVVYIGETMELTEQIFDQSANFFIDKYKLINSKGKRLNWKQLDNGSYILIRGLSNTKDPDQIRGHRSNCIIIDEFFHLKGELLQYMIQEVLEPMQTSYGHDYLFIGAGTPPRIKGSFGEWCWKNWDVPHFFWTYKNNPYPTDPQEKEEAITQKLREKGLDWDSVYARREYGGEWCYDDDLLLYPEIHTYNPMEAVPSFNVDMVLFGIDYGVSDNDTLIGIAWDTTNRRGYVFHEDKFSRLDIKDRTISQLEYLKGQVQYAWKEALQFFPSYSDKEANKRILWVADDNDQHITDDFNINCRIEGKDIRLNIMNAHKTDKVFMFDKIRDLLRTAALLLPEGGKTARECEQTVLKRGANGQVYPEVDDKVYHPDLLPAMRYALYNVIGNENMRKEI